MYNDEKNGSRKMNKFVPKRTIKRIEDNVENEKLRIMKQSIELSKEMNDDEVQLYGDAAFELKNKML